MGPLRTACIATAVVAGSLCADASQPYLSLAKGGLSTSTHVASVDAAPLAPVIDTADIPVQLAQLPEFHNLSEAADAATYFGDHSWDAASSATMPRMWMAGFGWWPPLVYDASVAREQFEYLGDPQYEHLDDGLLASFVSSCGAPGNHMPHICYTALANYSRATVTQPLPLRRSDVLFPASTATASAVTANKGSYALASERRRRQSILKLVADVVDAIEEHTLAGRRPPAADVSPAVTELVVAIRRGHDMAWSSQDNVAAFASIFLGDYESPATSHAQAHDDNGRRLAAVRILVQVPAEDGQTTQPGLVRVPTFTYLYELLGDSDFSVETPGLEDFTRLEIFAAFVKAFCARPQEPNSAGERTSKLEGGFGVSPLTGTSTLWLLLEQQHSVGLLEALLEKGALATPVQIDNEALPPSSLDGYQRVVTSDGATEAPDLRGRSPVAQAIYSAHRRRVQEANQIADHSTAVDSVYASPDRPGISLLHLVNTCHVVSSMAKTLLYIASMVEMDPAMPMPQHLAQIMRDPAFGDRLPMRWRFYLAGVAESFGFDYLAPRDEVATSHSNTNKPWLQDFAEFLEHKLTKSTRDIFFWEAQDLYSQVHGRLIRLLLNGPAPPASIDGQSTQIAGGTGDSGAAVAAGTVNRISLDEVALQDSLGNTPLHFAGSGGDRLMFTEVLHRALVDAVHANALQVDAAHGIGAFVRAYLSRNIDGRLPIHVAAVMWGFESEFVQSLRPAALVKAVGDGVRAALSTGTDTFPAEEELSHVLRSLAQRLQPAELVHDAHGEMASGYNARMLLPALEGRIPESVITERDCVQKPQDMTEELTGGWNVVPSHIRDFLETHSNGLPKCGDVSSDTPLNSAPGPGPRPPRLHQCDIQEIEGLPTPAQFHHVLSSSVPTIFRGAAKNWKFRDLWQFDKFKERYGNSTIMVGAIPYGSSYGFDMLNMTIGLQLCASNDGNGL